MICDPSDTWNAKCDIKLTMCKTSDTMCDKCDTVRVKCDTLCGTFDTPLPEECDWDEPKSLLACRHWQISWLVVVVALAGLAQRRLETTKVADLQGGQWAFSASGMPETRTTVSRRTPPCTPSRTW